MNRHFWPNRKLDMPWPRSAINNRYRAERGHCPTCSMTFEIVAARGVAPLRPATCAPIVDHAGLAFEGFEAFRLSHGCVCRVPEIGHGKSGQEVDIRPSFVVIEDALRSSDVKEDEVEALRQAWKVRRRG